MTLASGERSAIGMGAMSAREPLLKVDGLALRRGERLLFESIGFALNPGELLLLRGPNGAGKSSLLLTLAGHLRADAGAIAWGGDPETPQLHILGHSSGVKARLTLAENLRFWAAVNGPDGISPEAALEAVGLGGLGTIEAGHLSAGQIRRLALARLLVTKRPVWLMDEPTAALDAAGDGLVARLIGTHLAGGGAAIAATHDDIAGATATLVLGLPA